MLRLASRASIVASHGSGDTIAVDICVNGQLLYYCQVLLYKMSSAWDKEVYVYFHANAILYFEKTKFCFNETRSDNIIPIVTVSGCYSTVAHRQRCVARAVGRPCLATGTRLSAFRQYRVLPWRDNVVQGFCHQPQR